MAWRLALVLIVLVLASPASAHWRPGPHNALHAIDSAFGRYRWQARSVAWCESRWKPWAANGQYRGIFQMGVEERRAYGHGRDPWRQARAAYRYFKAAGSNWSPWECKPH